MLPLPVKNNLDLNEEKSDWMGIRKKNVFTPITLPVKRDICADQNYVYGENLSLVMRKADFCICEKKDVDQLRRNREADQHLYFRYTDSTIPLLPKYKISSL